MTAPATLGNWQRYGIDVSLHCRRCDTATLVMTADIVARLGEDYPVSEIGERARCSRCGHIGANVRAAVRSSGRC
jgi:hypothetical protein